MTASDIQGERVTLDLDPIGKGLQLAQLGQLEEANHVFDECTAALTAEDEPTRTRIAIALFNKGVALGQLERADDEIRTYDEVAQRFADASETSVRYPVSLALYNKALTLFQLGLYEAALEALDAFIARV